MILPAYLALLLQLTVNPNCLLIKINAVSGQANHFTLAHSGKGSHIQKILHWIALDCIQKLFHVFSLDRMHFTLNHFRQRRRIADIVPNISELYGLIQRLMQDAVDILYGFSRKPGLLDRPH